MRLITNNSCQKAYFLTRIICNIILSCKKIFFNDNNIIWGVRIINGI